MDSALDDEQGTLREERGDKGFAEDIAMLQAVRLGHQIKGSLAKLHITGAPKLGVAVGQSYPNRGHGPHPIHS